MKSEETCKANHGKLTIPAQTESLTMNPKSTAVRLGEHEARLARGLEKTVSFKVC